MGSGQGGKGGNGSLLFSNVVDTVVRMARMQHEANQAGDVLRQFPDRRPSGRDGDKERPPRLGNIAFDLAEMGLTGWRDLLDLQRRYEPELLAAWLTPGLAWMDPTAELVPDRGVLVFDTTAPTQDGASRRAVSDLTFENRSSAFVELLLPRTVQLERADGGDRVWVEVSSEPAAPIVGPGDDGAIKVCLWVPQRHFAPLPDEVTEARYFGQLQVRTRGALQVTVPILYVHSV